jgi:hypothetical protein
MSKQKRQNNSTPRKETYDRKRPLIFLVLAIGLTILSDVMVLPHRMKGFPHLAWLDWADVALALLFYISISVFLFLFSRVDADSLKVQVLKQNLKEHFIKILDDSSFNPTNPAGGNHA